MWLILSTKVQSDDEPLSSSYGRKAINGWPLLTAWQTISRGGSVRKARKPPSSRPILIYLEFRSKPSLITVICMDPHSPNKLFGTKYCFLIYPEIIRLSFSLFLYFSVFCFFTWINFYKNYFIIIIIIFFSHESYFYFFMFRNVPCSGFYRRPIWTVYNVIWRFWKDNVWYGVKCL